MASIGDDEHERVGAALLIGIGDYVHADRVWPLEYAARDAEAMAAILIDGDLCGFPADRVKVLADADAHRDAIVHHLSKWLPKQAEGADIVVIFFAGHGTVQTVGRREDGYLLPHDADPDDLLTRGILMADVARWIEAISAGTVIVCLDCCHAAKIVTRGGGGGRGGADPRMSLRDMRVKPAVLNELTGRGRYLIASCDEGQVSIEADTWQHGLFTHHLLEGIRGVGDRDGDGRVGVAELFEYVAEAVERDARAMGMVQRPWSSAVGPGGAFLSRPVRSTVASTKSTYKDTIYLTEEAPRRPEADDAHLPVDVLILRLESWRRSRDPEGIPTIFASLLHGSEHVRELAKRAVRGFGWEKISAGVLDLARRGDQARCGPVLAGLAAFEAHRDVVVLLDRLVSLLKGELRNQAILMLERKQLVLNMEKTAAVFREIQSPYAIDRVLGQGLFTSAYAARDQDDGLNVVVRVLRPEFAGQPAIRARFLDVSRQARRFVHQNLVLTREVRAVPERDLYFAVRDHVDGVTLQSLITAGTDFSAERILKILTQIARALAPQHRVKMAHAGVKPSNIFVRADDDIALGDPGLPVSILGTSLPRLSYDYRYAAPEMFQGTGEFPPAVDQYAIGCIAHEMACGRPPFVADNPYELASFHLLKPLDPLGLSESTLGAPFAELVFKMLAKSPAERFESIEEIADALMAMRAGLQPGDIRSAPEPEPGTFPYAATTPPPLAEAVSIFTFDPRTCAPSLIGAPMTGAPTAIPPGRSESSMPPQLGRFRTVRVLGKGGMGTVYLARDMELDRLVAIKVLDNMDRVDQTSVARFRREAVAAARLRHPGIMQIFDIGEQNGVMYLALEYVAGGSLSQRLRNDGPLGVEEAVRLVILLAQAVHAAHLQGVIHRDLKPGNVLLHEDGSPRIADFGLARLDSYTGENEAATMVGMPLGTPGYMAPEQVSGDLAAIGPETDVYGLGTILYQCLTGRVPFPGTAISALYQVMNAPPAPPRSIRPEIPAALERICLKCLEKKPGDRFAGAYRLAAALERFLGSPEDDAVDLDDDHVRPMVSDSRHLPPRVSKSRASQVKTTFLGRLSQWFTGRGRRP